MASRVLIRNFQRNYPYVAQSKNLIGSLGQSSGRNNVQPRFQNFITPSSFFHTSIVRNNQFIINIQDDEDFKSRVLASDKPVVVDFHATWCGPCKLLGPRLESQIAAQNGSVILAKVDIDDHSDLAIDHGVQAVPTVVAIKKGKIVDKFVGLKDDSALESFVKNLVGK